MVDRRLIVIVVVVVLSGVVILGWLPWLREPRGVIASTPAPAPFSGGTNIRLKPKQVLCLDQVTFDRHSEIARLDIVESAGRKTPRMTFTVMTSEKRRVATIPVSGGRVIPTAVAVPLPAHLPSFRRSFEGVFCIEQHGSRAISFLGTNEPQTNGRVNVRIDGQLLVVPAPGMTGFPDVTLGLYERGERSLLTRRGEILDHAATFKPLAPWHLWILTPLVLIALLVGPTWAVMRALRDSDPHRSDHER